MKKLGGKGGRAKNAKRALQESHAPENLKGQRKRGTLLGGKRRGFRVSLDHLEVEGRP